MNQLEHSLCVVNIEVRQGYVDFSVGCLPISDKKVERLVYFSLGHVLPQQVALQFLNLLILSLVLVLEVKQVCAAVHLQLQALTYIKLQLLVFTLKVVVQLFVPRVAGLPRLEVIFTFVEQCQQRVAESLI